MNSFDWIVIGLLTFGLIKGLFNGFIKEVLSLVGLVGGLVVAYLFQSLLTPYYQALFELSTSIATTLSFFTLFISVIILVKIIGHFATKALEWMALGFLNRLIGGMFGALKWGGFLTVFAWAMNKLFADGDPPLPVFFKESMAFDILIETSKTISTYL